MIGWVLLAAAALAAAATGGALLANRAPLLRSPGPAERLRVYLTRNVALTRDDHPFPELRTREFAGEPGALARAVEAACRELDWENCSHDAAQGTVRAVIRTPLLGFRDDLEARAEAAGPGKSRLRVRSASRVGRGDLGANARHVARLHAAVGRRLEPLRR